MELVQLVCIIFPVVAVRSLVRNRHKSESKSQANDVSITITPTYMIKIRPVLPTISFNFGGLPNDACPRLKCAQSILILFSTLNNSAQFTAPNEFK